MSDFHVIMAHREAEPTVRRHLRFWRQPGGPLLFYSSVDKKLLVDGHQNLVFGKSGHHGVESIARFRFLLKHMSTRAAEYDRLIIWEYDSFCVSPRMPETNPDVVTANAFINHDPAFSAKWHTHAPLVIPMAILQRLVPVMEKLPNDAEFGFWDRWMGQLCALAGVEIESFCEGRKDGFSMNTFHEANFPVLKQAVLNGVRVIHGVKDAAALKIITDNSPWLPLPNQTK